MAQNTVYTESVVTLNNQEATARIDELKQHALELRKEMARLAQEKGINTKEFKQAQKELVACEKAQRDLNESSKKFEKVINDLNGSSLNQLQSALRKLQQQWRNAKPNTPEYEAYSKKIKEVRARMRELEDQGRQTQKLFGGFFSKIGWAGIVTGAIALFRKFAKDMIAQTQAIGDKWKYETAGWKSAYGSFVADLSTGKGWNEMIDRMKTAYKVGKQVAQMLDEMFERNNSLSLQESEMNLEAEKQRKLMMDATKTAQERLAAAEEYDRIQQQIAQNRKNVAKQELDAYQLQLQARTNLSDAELDAFVKDYNSNLELIQQARDYQEQYKEMETRVNSLYNTMISGNGSAYNAYKERYDQAVADFETFKQTADKAVVYWSGVVDKYNLGNDDMVKNYVQARQKFIDADVNYERATQRSNRTAATLRKQLADEGVSAAKKAYDEAVKASDLHFKELENQAKAAYAAGEISETEYQNRLTSLQEASLKDRLAIAEKYKQSTVELTSQLLDLSIKEAEQIRKVFADTEAEAAKAVAELLDETIDGLDDLLDEGLDEFIDRWNELRDQADQIRRALDPATALKEDMDAELKVLDEAHANNLIAEEDYQKARAELVKRYQQEITAAQLAPYAAGIEAAQKSLDQISSFFDALQSAASARLDAQMEAELTAAGDNAEQREQIEADYEQKKLDLQKRYANVNMGIEIAKTVASGAAAVVKALAELGPIAGAVATGVIAATTAAQVATIIAQRNAIMNSSVSGSGSAQATVGERVAGFSEGGFTGRRSNDYAPVGIVHANEWVAPAAMVRADPVTFATLESIRRSGSYRSATPGFASGGSAGPAQTSPVSGANAEEMQLIRQTRDLLQQLLDSLPLPAYVVLSQMNAAQELDTTIKQIAGK